MYRHHQSDGTTIPISGESIETTSVSCRFGLVITIPANRCCRQEQEIFGLGRQAEQQAIGQDEQPWEQQAGANQRFAKPKSVDEQGTRAPDCSDAARAHTGGGHGAITTDGNRSAQRAQLA